ncbi:hypothetical protein [Paenibacillus sp. HJGM_3]|uniref:hypothetical protein n=1 Tax=Paenibacillus sp. HJGM_3 TaxID=3379816 RepID=UPI00385F26F5
MNRSQRDVTIYNYKLVLRIRHRLIWLALYGLLPVGVFASVAIRYGLPLALWTPAGFIGMMWLHGVVSWLDLRFSADRVSRTWRLVIRFPWLGLLPDQPVSLRVVRRLQSTQLLIGTACIGVVYPWVAGVAVLQLLVTHVWILLPTFWMLARFRAASRHGLLKIGPKETSYYVE